MIHLDWKAAEVYLYTFAARTDDYALWTGRQWARAGEPLRATRIYEAFAQRRPVSTYTQKPDGTTHIAALDFDTDDGWTLAQRVQRAMAARGAPAYISPSRRGGHLWAVLDGVLAARMVRRALRGFLAAASVKPDPKIELRPAYDTIKADGFGAPIRMPTMVHPKTGARYPFVAPDGRVLGPRLTDIVQVDLAPTATFVTVAEEFRPPLDPTRLRPELRPPRPVYPPDNDSASDILRRLWGVPNAQPGRSVRCPAHDDRVASLSIPADDERVFCQSPSCRLHNNGRGVGLDQLRKLVHP